MRLGLLAVCLSAGACAAAWAAEGGRAGAPPADERRRPDPTLEAALRRSGGAVSVHELLLRAAAMAREWSPGAALYSALGFTPRNQKLWEPEKWTFVFGDPQTRDGSFEVVFLDGALHTRAGIKDGVRMKEFFKDGKFEERTAGLEPWSGGDYDHCAPIAPEFLDSPRVFARVLKLKLRPAQMNQYRMALLNPRTNHCDGLGYLSQFITEKPVPKRLRKRTLWVVSGEEETLFLHPLAGRLLLRRPRAAEKPAEQAPPPDEGDDKENPTLVPIRPGQKGWAPIR